MQGVRVVWWGLAGLLGPRGWRDIGMALRPLVSVQVLSSGQLLSSGAHVRNHNARVLAPASALPRVWLCASPACGGMHMPHAHAHVRTARTCGHIATAFMRDVGMWWPRVLASFLSFRGPRPQCPPPPHAPAMPQADALPPPSLPPSSTVGDIAFKPLPPPPLSKDKDGTPYVTYIVVGVVGLLVLPAGVALAVIVVRRRRRSMVHPVRDGHPARPAADA